MNLCIYDFVLCWYYMSTRRNRKYYYTEPYAIQQGSNDINVQIYQT